MFVVERGLSYRGLPQEGNCRRVVFAQSGFCPTEVSALNRCLCGRCLPKNDVCAIVMERCLSLRSLPQKDNWHRVVSAVEWCLS